jgi:DUF4097 and DUF4098 domain-containing protein YvlB
MMARLGTFALHSAATVAAALPVLAAAGTPLNARTPATAADRVQISNTAGSVQVRGWARSEVEVTGELGKGSERLEFTRTGDTVLVKVVLPRSSRNVDGTRLVVNVPSGSRVAVHTVSADVDARGIAGMQRLESVSGNVHAEIAGADVECRTVSGELTVIGAGRKGLVSLTTVSGDATATRVAGEVNASTVSGTVKLGAGETARSRVRSTSGDVTVSGQLAANANVDIESLSGDVRLDLLGTPAASFELVTTAGDIDNCFGPKPASGEFSPGQKLRFQQGTGAGRVRIETMSGDIRLCTRQP